MGVKQWQADYVTEKNRQKYSNTVSTMQHGKWISPLRPGDDCLTETRKHAARLRHPNRRLRWRTWLPAFRRKAGR